MTKRWRNLLLWSLPFALLVPLFVGIPLHLRFDPVIGALGSRYHVGLFLALTLLFYHHGPLRGRLAVVVAVCLLLGAATELLQPWFGRSTALKDWALNAQGIGFAVCLIWYRRTRRPALPVLGAVILAALLIWPLRHLPVAVPETRAAHARFPVLEDFERPRSLILWSRQSGIQTSLIEVTGRGQVAQMDVHHKTDFPGIYTRRLPWYWSDQSELRVDLRLVAPSPDSLLVTVLIEDRAGPGKVDTATKTFMVGHQWQTLVVPLAELTTRHRGRPVTGEVITKVGVFVAQQESAPVSFQIDRLWLVPRREPG